MRISTLLFFAVVLLLISLFFHSHGKVKILTSEFAEVIVPPLGLPPVPWPKDNLYSKDKAELGRLLYFDKRLSTDGTISCASCHNIPCAYSDCKAIAVGIDHRKGTRHSPTIINAAYSTHFFWDGHALSLEEQCKGPLFNVREMSNISDVHEAHRECEQRVKSIPGYHFLFEKTFGVGQISVETIAKAIATFERTLLSGNSPYDRYQAGNKQALSHDQIYGMQLFNQVGCANCHSGFNFTNDSFHNIGIGMDKPDPDLGRYLVTHNESDWGAFKVPTLREIAHTKPYMHDGSFETLEAVVDYYDQGGIANQHLHPLMQPLHLSASDKAALISFLKSLSGEGWQHFHEPAYFPN